MKKITQFITICAAIVFTFTAEAQSSSSQVANRVSVPVEMQNEIQEAIRQQQTMESQNSGRALMATYVGSFNTSDGPYWGDNPPVYSGVEAAALIFGGSPSDYAISTNPNTVDPATITHTAWVTTWGIGGCQEMPEDYSLDLGAPGYNDPGGNNTAVSAYTYDNCVSGNENFVWYVGGAATNAFVTTWTVNASDLSITIPTFAGSTYNYSVNWGDGSPVQNGFTGNATHVYPAAGTYTVEITGLFPQIYFNNYGDKNKIQSIEQWGDNAWTSMNRAFMGATNLVSNATDTPDLSMVTNMFAMFGYAEAFEGDANIGNWDVSNVTEMYGAFGGAKVFNADISNWNVGNVTNMKLMFSHAVAFNQDISNWNVSNVNNMDSMFRGAYAFDQSLGNWNVGNVINMNNMFKDVKLSVDNYDATLMGWNNQLLKPNVVFNGGLSEFCEAAAARANMITTLGWTITDGGQVCPPSTYFITTWETSMANETITVPTNGNSHLYDINWNYDENNPGIWQVGLTGNATHTYPTAGTHTIAIRGHFPHIYFNNSGDRLKIKTIEQWGNNVWSSMERAFMGCANLVSNATDTPNLSMVNNMFGAFAYAESFTGDANIGNWDVSNVTEMHGVFGGATVFNADISNWDVGNVTNMKFMFSHARAFNQDLSNWNVGNVTNMDSMFRGAIAFDQYLGSWNVSNVGNMQNMFKDVTLSSSNYDATLIDWNNQSLRSNVKFDGGFSTYCAAMGARNNMIINLGWTITDGGQSCDPNTFFITTWETTMGNETITIPTRGGSYSYDVNWNYDENDPGSWETGITGNATHTYAAPGIHTVAIRGGFPQIYFNNSGDKLKIQTIEQWGSVAWRSMNSAFMGCQNLISKATDAPDLSLVTDAYAMFAYAEAFNGDINIGNWDVSNVTNMHGMFGGASIFNADISNWDVSNVTNMKFMFSHASEFNQNIGSWDVSSVVNMDSMFRVAKSFDQDLGNWNVSNVTTMENMFKDAALSTSNYDALLNGWNGLTLQNNVKFNGGQSTYCNGEIARQNIIANFSWTIVDGGLDCSAPFTGDRLHIEDNNLISTVTLYPNPMQSELILNNANNTQLSSASIYDLTGRLIKTVNLKGMDSEVVLNVSDLSKATYLVMVTAENGSQISKLVVKQ